MKFNQRYKASNKKEAPRGGYSGLVVTEVWGPSLEPHTYLQGWFLGKVVPMARDFLQKVDPCLGISDNKYSQLIAGTNR